MMNNTKNDPAVGCPLERRVRVVTNMCDLPDNWPLTQSAFEMWIIRKLKNAGIPIIGTLCFIGIERGTITRFEDMENFDSIIWEWNPNVN